MAKPGTLPTWDTNATNIATPPAGYQSDGWANGETVKSTYFNWFMMWAALWIAWLNGLWGADGTLTLDSGADVVLSGDGRVKRAAPLTRGISLAAGSFRSGGGVYQTIIGSISKWQPMHTALGDEFHVPITLSQEEVLTAVSFNQVTAAGSTMSYYLMRVEESGGFMAETALQTLNATDATATLVSWSGMSVQVDPTKFTQFYVVAKQTNGGGGTSGFLSGITATTTAP